MTDTPGHLDLDALADVLAGERDDAHLRSCLPCTDRLAELAAADASVTAALGALPAPPLPAGLSERLARALEQERRREVTVVRPLGRRTRTSVRPWLPAAAASVALVLSGAVGFSLLDLSGTSSQDASTTAAGRAQGGAESQSADAGSAAEAEVESQVESAAPDTAAGLAVPRTDVGTDWADDAARTAAVARLMATPATALPRPPAGAADDGLARLRDPAALAPCLSALPGGDAGVLAVDGGTYAGTPAVAVLQPDDPALVRITVVGSGCSAADPQVLATHAVPRPAGTP